MRFDTCSTGIPVCCYLQHRNSQDQPRFLAVILRYRYGRKARISAVMERLIGCFLTPFGGGCQRALFFSAHQPRVSRGGCSGRSRLVIRSAGFSRPARWIGRLWCLASNPCGEGWAGKEIGGHTVDCFGRLCRRLLALSSRRASGNSSSEVRAVCGSVASRGISAMGSDGIGSCAGPPPN